jgi:hypothetical protein
MQTNWLTLIILFDFHRLYIKLSGHVHTQSVYLYQYCWNIYIRLNSLYSCLFTIRKKKNCSAKVTNGLKMLTESLSQYMYVKGIDFVGTMW